MDLKTDGGASDVAKGSPGHLSKTPKFASPAALIAYCWYLEPFWRRLTTDTQGVPTALSLRHWAVPVLDIQTCYKLISKTKLLGNSHETLFSGFSPQRIVRNEPNLDCFQHGYICTEQCWKFGSICLMAHEKIDSQTYIRTDRQTDRQTDRVMT